MSTYYLRIEAVNFDNFLADTHDLSTVRGGGLLMLEAVEQDLGLKKVYAGASTGLFEFEAPDDEAAETQRACCEKKLHQGALAHGTIMVDVHVAGTFKVSEILARLTTENRLRQMTSPSVIMPAASGQLVCEVNDLHPAVNCVYRKGARFVDEPQKKIPVSRVVEERREHGLEAKFKFYPQHEYVNDLDQLTDCPRQDLLHHKLALIYLDGNGFGKILQKCLSKDRLGAWSDLIKANQNEFLRHVLTRAVAEKSWQWSGDVFDNEGRKMRKENAIRLETLLWGGDEIIWVVPAWKGWWMLGEFFRTFGHVEGKPLRTSFSLDGKKESEQMLTHGASLVFAHHNAPIHRLVQLAKELADAPKKRGKAPHPPGNWFSYQILESFDHLGTKLDDARASRLPATVGIDALCVPGDRMQQIPALMHQFRQNFPKSQLHQLTRGGPQGRKTIDPKAGQGVLAKYQLQKAFEDLRQLLASPSEEAAWYHLAELWDYTPVAEVAHA